MARTIGSWFSASRAARENSTSELGRWRGEQLGLPASGPRSVAPISRRVAGFLIDIVLGGLVAALFTIPDYPGNWSVLGWFLITVVPVSVFGFTPGMSVTGIWVARLDGSTMVGVPRAVLRCVLTFLLIPAAVFNQDGRAWHDRLTGTVVVRR